MQTLLAKSKAQDNETFQCNTTDDSSEVLINGVWRIDRLTDMTCKFEMQLQLPGVTDIQVNAQKYYQIEFALQGVSSGTVSDLGWVDLDLGGSPGWWAATVANYCPIRVVGHPKSKSTQPRSATR